MVKYNHTALISMIGLIIFGLACGSARYEAEAEKAAPLFHDKLNAGKYDEIYDEADEEFKAITSKGDFIKICERLREKLGNVKRAKPTKTEVKHEANKTMVMQIYEVEFTKDKGVEQFIWVAREGPMKLGGYHAYSAALEKP
jgi:hypothetical protein